MCESKASQLAIIDKEVTRLRSLDADNKGLKECNSLLTDENEALRKRIAVLESFMRPCDLSAAEIELSAQKGTE